MPTQQTTNNRRPVIDSPTPMPTERDQSVRDLAIKQLERRRRFLAHAVGTAVATAILLIIWATTEYNNAGGWPSHGFSQSSSIPHVWNIWIIYPVIGLALILAINGWRTYYQKPISESEIRREMNRLTDTR
jgi:protein-S-isoprenylcysteine O-methyltransferase Ste14